MHTHDHLEEYWEEKEYWDAKEGKVIESEDDRYWKQFHQQSNQNKAYLEHQKIGRYVAPPKKLHINLKVLKCNRIDPPKQ